SSQHGDSRHLHSFPTRRSSDLDPATVQRLRGEGLTFPEVARTVTLAHRLGTDLGTTIRFVRGSLSASDLAGRLGMPQEMLQQTVQQTARETSTSSSPFLSSPR